MILHSWNYSAQLNQSKWFCSAFLFYENIWIKLKYFVVITLWHDAHLDDNILTVQWMMIVLKWNMINTESVAIFLVVVSHHFGPYCMQAVALVHNISNAHMMCLLEYSWTFYMEFEAFIRFYFSSAAPSMSGGKCETKVKHFIVHHMRRKCYLCGHIFLINWYTCLNRHIYLFNIANCLLYWYWIFIETPFHWSL